MSLEREKLRMLINQSLSLAAAEIFELFERTIAEYEEQLCPSKEEKHTQHWKQHMTQEEDSGNNKPEQHTQHTTDIQQVLVGAESFGGEQQERGGLSLDQEDPPEPAHIKEEEETWSHQETEEQLHGNNQEEEEEEEEDSEFTLTPVPAKNQEEEEEAAESSQLHDKQPEDMLDSPSETDDSSYYLEEFAPPHSPLNHRADMETEETTLTFSEPEHEAGKIQNKKKTFSCLICQKELSRKDALVRHMRVHTETKTFSSSVCGKSFSKKSTLFKNQETHAINIQHESRVKIETAANDVKSNNQESSSEFASSSDQKEKPQKLHEIKPGDKPFSCPVCERGFNAKRNLKRHMSSHTGEKPFVCSLCGKRFVQNRHLKRHLLCHSGEKPFRCPVCGKSFAMQQNLRLHSYVHSGEKPYGCSQCGKRFVQPSHLKKHAAVHA